ncbi:hypothetical protein FT643_22590 [Ketobacter sp. MCCC 1A13808]|uniref:DUF6236 family protein n=1 Tax=Ketobacter sp. MCCC 1A13808 TaxID=2602738 RepID=UPI0012EC6BD5|nr:DUF6236 family protein [Ketobacter sp. MCCC 1A13808]MVF14926.1 hypothetical protein [Ketobacter sp. MCCC 1A13808]
MSKKGIVLSPLFEVLPNGGLKYIGEPPPLELRKYLMYWDEIDYPSNGLINIYSPNMDYLETTNSLKRTRVGFSSGLISDDGEYFIEAQEAALRLNQEKEPGSWSLAQMSAEPQYSQGNIGVSVDFELYGMLPVPSEDTPLSDILEFKEKRRDELIAFRVYLDDIYQKIIGSADIPRSRNSEVTKLENALKDLDRALNEGKIKRVVTNIRNTITQDFSGVVGAGLGSISLPSLIDMSPLMVGMAGAGIVVGFKSMFLPNIIECPSQYNYLKSIRKSFNVNDQN